MSRNSGFLGTKRRPEIPTGLLLTGGRGGHLYNGVVGCCGVLFSFLDVLTMLLIARNITHIESWCVTVSTTFTAQLATQPGTMVVSLLADRTNGRAIGTVLHPSVCLSSVRNVLWLNGAS